MRSPASWPVPVRAAADRPLGFQVLFPALADAAEVYLDSASTTQKPLPVIEAIQRYHSTRTANAGRGTYSWATGLERSIETVRERTATFLGAAAEEVVFTPGATAGLNAVALAWGLAALDDGDEILYSPRDHASNVYPWLQLQATLARFGRHIRLIPYRVTALGEADTADILAKIGPRTRLITVSHLHHVFGGLTTLEELRGRVDPRILLCFDCSQSGGHLPVDVAALGADFAVLSAHKMFGAPGTGVLYCRRRVHEQLTTFLPGGNSGAAVTDSVLRPTGMPRQLEGGTHNIPGILALGAALEVLDTIGVDVIAEHNRVLTRHLVDGLRSVPGLEFLPGPAYAPCETGYGIVSFTLDGIGSTDLGFVLAELGFLVRTGAHCIPADGADPDADSVRVSTHIYTTGDDIDRFVRCVATIASEVR
ncbi:aminotransferase class V-fold PLP-dependent enzyme [Nocardia transvalensis]|uniref:aminotransferase class V-fold PLP-dependent enzyme n=1 Tax=Nocardia transvalensis TaxID=37333 RepID=UPI001894BA63|nr:aminotransferase class V-fold PLP-dependent enzyme [Nocardia transvalensis]MBF6328005.1 aminotransferase class V-fold PLP-dependent enzyme [Nocardia transvalensis]